MNLGSQNTKKNQNVGPSVAWGTSRENYKSYAATENRLDRFDEEAPEASKAHGCNNWANRANRANTGVCKKNARGPIGT